MIEFMEIYEKYNGSICQAGPVFLREDSILCIETRVDEDNCEIHTSRPDRKWMIGGSASDAYKKIEEYRSRGMAVTDHPLTKWYPSHDHWDKGGIILADLTKEVEELTK